MDLNDFGKELLLKGLDVEKARQQAKASNVGASQIVAANTATTPMGVQPEVKPKGGLQTTVGGIPLWGLLLGGAAAAGIAWRVMR